jgi:hypothetical protein
MKRQLETMVADLRARKEKLVKRGTWTNSDAATYPEREAGEETSGNSGD